MYLCATSAGASTSAEAPSVIGEQSKICSGSATIIDFKTSTNNKGEHQIGDYYLQTTAYALMFAERYDIHIDDIVILMSVEKGAVPLVFQQQIDPYIEPLLKRINTFHNTYGAK